MIRRNVAVLLLLAAGADANKFKIVAWGDMPYIGESPDVFNDTELIGTKTAGEVYKLLVDSINSEGAVFATHVGDTKSGSQLCEDPYYSRFEDLANAVDIPVLYAPGDNEWVDCHPSVAGSYDPIERLAYVRDRFFTPRGKVILGKDTHTVKNITNPYPDYPEIQIFSYGEVMFILLHVTGSSNSKYQPGNCPSSLNQIDPNCNRAYNEYLARDTANVRALRQGFTQAGRSKASGVMVFMQANMFNGPCSSRGCGTNYPIKVADCFANVWNALQQYSISFGKPVALIHGDFHYYQSFTPDPTIPNLVATQVPGDDDIGYVLVDVDTSKPSVFTYSSIEYIRE